MNTLKVAISIPEEIVKSIDRLRKSRGISRSKYITNTMIQKIHEELNRELKAQYDKIFSEPGMQEEQSETTEFFKNGDRMEGQEWQ